MKDIEGIKKCIKSWYCIESEEVKLESDKAEQIWSVDRTSLDTDFKESKYIFHSNGLIL